MKLHNGDSRTEFVCMCCMEYRWRQTPRRGWICPYRAKDIYCPIVEHVYLREQYDEFSWAQMERNIEKNIELNKQRMEREAAGEKTIHKMNLLTSHFVSVERGIKCVEMRLDDEKRRWIRLGDLIEFTCADDIERKLMVEVSKKTLFLDFEELVRNYDSRILGFDGQTAEEICKYMKNLYGEQKLKACHVVAIEFVKCGDEKK